LKVSEKWAVEPICTAMSGQWREREEAGKLRIFGALALLGTALAITGCKSTPELTKADAQALIQAEYDHRPAVGAPIAVQDLGMGQGLIAKYWVKSRSIPIASGRTLP
jgi:hypothetical protein